MSGPKPSSYTVTEEQRRALREQALREQREKELREQAIREQKARELREQAIREQRAREQAIREQKIKELKEHIISGINELQKLPGDLNTFYDSIAGDMQKRDLETEQLATELKSFQAEINKFAQSNANLNLALGELEVRQRALVSFKRSIQQKHLGLREKIAAAKGELLNSLQESIYNALDLNLCVDEDSKTQAHTSAESDKLNAEINIIQGHLREMAAHKALPGILKEEINKTTAILAQIRDLNYLKNFRAITYSRIKKAYDDFRQNLADQEMAQLLAVKEQEYITTCLEEVMLEMGYDLLGARTVVKKNGKQFKNELYSFDQDTVLNVTYAADGKITLEVGKADKFDREPTSYEAEKLIEEMDVFCADYAEIENKLIDRGVLIKSKDAHLPPTAANAQIINISDFNIDTLPTAGKGARSQKGKKGTSASTGTKSVKSDSIG